VRPTDAPPLLRGSFAGHARRAGHARASRVIRSARNTRGSPAFRGVVGSGRRLEEALQVPDAVGRPGVALLVEHARDAAFCRPAGSKQDTRRVRLVPGEGRGVSD